MVSVWGVGSEESNAVTMNVNVPALVGDPETVPLAGSRINPGGNEPEEIDHASGAVPPVAVSTDEYGLPTVPAGIDGVAIESGGLLVATVTVKGPAKALGLTPFEAVTAYGNEVMPDGTVPEMTPVVASIDSQGGAPVNAKVEFGLPVAANV